jgi:hypothetical protein
LQRIELKQPGLSALEWLAEQDGIHVNVCEPALDYIFNNWAVR